MFETFQERLIMLSKEELASCKAEEIPLRKNWWLSIQNERGSEKFEAFDFIKIKLTSGDIEIPVTSIMVRAIDGLVMESHSIVSKLIHMNIKAQEQEVADLEKENERLKEAIGYLVKVPTQSYEKELARKLADLERKLAVAKSFMQKLDQYLCERIIDPCGYDPEAEAKEDLVDTVRANSADNDIMLTKLRAALKEIEGN
ncbi:MAG: hypothetical protein ACK5RO_10770 [Pseudobdellovibrionaceae bacterium]